MSNFWTLEGMYEHEKKRGKKSKKKDSDDFTKKKKKKDKEKDFKKSKNGKKKKEKSAESVEHHVSFKYADFLKDDSKGLFKAVTDIDGKNYETYIIKDDKFEFPRVALSSSFDSYKDWLRKRIENNGSETSINKILYATIVSPIDIPEGLLHKIINSSKEDIE